MIVFLEGVLAEKNPTSVIIQAGGLGYELHIPLSSYDRLPAPGEPVRLLTHFHVREDAQLLYGFATADERSLFERLIAVSGIGPRLALSVLSGLSPRDLRKALAEGDVKRLSSVSGIGKKTAERMVLELRDKLGEGEILEAAGAPPADARLQDAVMALISLGYKQAEARKMIADLAARIEPGHAVEDLVRLALTR